MPSSIGSPQPRDQTQVSHIADGFFNHLSHQGSFDAICLCHFLLKFVSIFCVLVLSNLHEWGVLHLSWRKVYAFEA